MTVILEAPCINCGRPVKIDRTGAQVRVLEQVGRVLRSHICREPKNRPGAKA